MIRSKSIRSVAALSAILLTACGGAAPAAPTTAPQAPVAQATQAPAAAEATKAPEPTKVQAPPRSEKFTYWGGLIFSDVANKMLEDRVKQWGTERGIEVEVVMINQNETQQKVSAAIEAGSMPDALDLGSGTMQLLAKNGQLEGLDDVFAKIGDAHGGWLDAASASIDPAKYGGKI